MEAEIDTESRAMLPDPMVLSFILLVCGLLMAVAPRSLVTRAAGAFRRRLEEIEQGAPEDYFEERRALTAYSFSRGSVMFWRIWGVVTVVVSAALLLRAGLTG